MRNFATEVSRIVHSFGEMDELAVKVASADASQMAQESVAKGSSALYDVIRKVAEDTSSKEHPSHYKMTTCLNKIARALGKDPFPPTVNLKIASIVAVDDALSAVLQANPEGAEKLAEMRYFGREYLMEVLRGVI